MLSIVDDPKAPGSHSKESQALELEALGLAGELFLVVNERPLLPVTVEGSVAGLFVVVSLELEVAVLVRSAYPEGYEVRLGFSFSNSAN